MNRRTFAVLVFRSAVTVLSIMAWPAVTAVRRVIEARRSRRYPGPVLRVDHETSRQPGPWAG